MSVFLRCSDGGGLLPCLPGLLAVLLWKDRHGTLAYIPIFTITAGEQNRRAGPGGRADEGTRIVRSGLVSVSGGKWTSCGQRVSEAATYRRLTAGGHPPDRRPWEGISPKHQSLRVAVVPTPAPARCWTTPPRDDRHHSPAGDASSSPADAKASAAILTAKHHRPSFQSPRRASRPDTNAAIDRGKLSAGRCHRRRLCLVSRR